MSDSGEGPGLGAGTAGRVLHMATELRAPAWERRLELGFWLALWRVVDQRSDPVASEDVGHD